MTILTKLQKQAAHAVVNIFETSRVRGDYGRVTVLAQDTGHLTYGRSQTTLASGNLALLLHAYVEAEGELAADFEPLLQRFDDRDTSLDHDESVKQLLHAAGRDTIMHTVQDSFFDRVYWEPAIRRTDRLGIDTPLGASIMYDGQVHGSAHRMVQATNERHGPIGTLSEQDWLGRYVDTRREWLANHSNTGLHATVYRMDEFVKLIDAGNWNLALPFAVRGIVISEESLNAEYASPHTASAEGVADRVLMLKNPYMRGADVRRLQEALRDALGAGEPEPDGVFGPNTEGLVRRFQSENGLVVDGKAGRATWSLLSA